MDGIADGSAVMVEESVKPDYIHGVERSEQERLESLARMLGGAAFLPPLEPGMQIVEVGCGTGAITREVAAQISPGEVVGVDREEAQIVTAALLASEQRITNLRFRRGEATDLELPEASFDGAYCRFLLEHVHEPVKVVSEMARVVKPQGWVCAFEWQNSSHACYPATPTVWEVWRAVYRLQDEVGGDSSIAPKMYEIFAAAGLGDVQVQGKVWTCTANQRERLQWYVSSARQIIEQTREELLARNLVTQQTLDTADGEYEELLASPVAFVLEVMCCATGRVAGRASGSRGG